MDDESDFEADSNSDNFDSWKYFKSNLSTSIGSKYAVVQAEFEANMKKTNDILQKFFKK